MSYPGYHQSMLSKHIGKRITVTAIYESLVSDYKRDSEFVLLIDVRNLGGDLLRDHIWCPEIDAFRNMGNIEKGSIIKFDGIASEYSKGIDSKTIDYELNDIGNLRIVGNRHSQVMCDSCDYSIRTKEMELKINNYERKKSKKINKDLSMTKSNSELKNALNDLKQKNNIYDQKKRSLTAKNNHLRKILEDLYKISQRKTVKNIDRLKQRINIIIGNAIKCRDCDKKLNKCRCGSSRDI